ncbi:MAG TPA: serine hydrolase [Chloroflexaceae bacterium]|nr:serine hydrolase [Chloroflexaceae bacterium]
METPPEGQELRAVLEAKLQPFAQGALAAFGLAGLAVGVVRAGRLVYAQGFGVRSLATGEPVTPRSLFHLASVSKPFVATAIVQLVERGRIGLDEPVRTYLPYFRLRDPRHKAITVRRLLTHTSGMPDEVEPRWHAPEDDDGALERYVRGLADRELRFEPGERYAYSNIAFEVLGDVVAKVAGQTFEDYVKAHILDPLAMGHSTFLRREVAPALAVTPHFGMPMVVLEGAYPYHRAHGPSSTLHSSVEEMSHWLIANMARGRFGGGQILRPESYDLLWHPYVRTGEEIWTEALGLSWQFGTYRGRQVIHHSGSDPGFSSELVILPEADAAVVVFVNANTAATGIVTDATLDILLGLDPEPPRPPITVPLGAALAASGPEAAGELYRRLQATEPDRYDASPSRFLQATWGAVELHRLDAVMPLVRLWVALQPDAALAHEVLGWAQLIRGEREAAAENLRRALDLDPAGEHARGLLELLGA